MMVNELMIIKSGEITLAMIPKEQPETIIGNITTGIFKSIKRPFPFLRGWGLFAFIIYLIVQAIKILIFDNMIAYF